MAELVSSASLHLSDFAACSVSSAVSDLWWGLLCTPLPHWGGSTGTTQTQGFTQRPPDACRERPHPCPGPRPPGAALPLSGSPLGPKPQRTKTPSVPPWGDGAVVSAGLLQPCHQPCLAVRVRMAACVKIRVWMSRWLKELTCIHTENLRRLVF